MKFTNICASLFVTGLTFASGSNELTADNSLVYDNTRICSRHHVAYCLGYNSDSKFVTLTSHKRLRFEVEQVEGVNLKLNRIYTFAEDEATRKSVKSCLISQDIPGSELKGLGLAPCDTDDRELVLSMTGPIADPTSPGHFKIDEFTLRELSYMEKNNAKTILGGGEAMCLTFTHTKKGEIQPVHKKADLKSGALVTLQDCATKGNDSSEYSQELKARRYTKASSTSVHFTETEQEEDPRIARFCLDTKSDLCIGMSLTNGQILEDNKLVQVKNYTKNSAKELDQLKMEWFLDYENTRFATAANMEFCLEAIYNAPIGNNRHGTPQFDDVVHLGACGNGQEDVRFEGLETREQFYTKQVLTAEGSYMEIRTDVPEKIVSERSEAGKDSSSTKCVSVVKCVVHDFDHCTPYNSVPVYDTAELSQGAYVRLKDCDSESMPSQRFQATFDVDQTAPPTRFPTTPPPTDKPSHSPTVTPTKKPTDFPTTEAPSAFPTKNPTNAENSEEKPVEPINPVGGKGGLKIALSMVGVLCVAVIVVGAGYYYKNKAGVQKLPEEDENFIARV